MWEKKKFAVRAVAMAGVAAASLGWAVAAATPADAATGYARCPTGSFCAFSELNGKGAMATFKNGDADLGHAPGPSGMNNTIASVYNRSGKTFYLYGKPGYKGYYTYCVASCRGNMAKGWRQWASSINH